MKRAYSYIRFSTPEQEMGDSERRQLALAEGYCARNGLKLSQESFADKGVSAYRGKHREKGALGRLLKQLKPGDCVLVENIDRWSREDPLDSLPELRKAVYSGTEFIFLQENVRVTKDNSTSAQIRYLLFFGADRAHGESDRKRQMIKAVWDQKKEQARAGKAVRMSRLPCWLEWDEKANKPVVVGWKAKIIRRMFSLACAGQFVLDICRKMRGTLPITNAKKPLWNPTSVRRILTDKAVCGYYTQAEPPVAGVWPVVVDEATFCRAQPKLEFAGKQKRPGKSEINLFTGLAKCARCGSSLVAHTWAKGVGQARLVCGGAGTGRSHCSFAGAPLALIEKSFLAFLADGDLIRPLLAAQEVKPSKLEELQARLEAEQKQAGKLAKLILGDDDPPRLLYSALKEAEAQAKSLQAEIESENERIKGEAPALQSYLDFCNQLAGKANDKAYRPELRRAISSVVQSITLDPRGEKRGVWDYSVQLKGHGAPVEVRCVAKPEGWLFRSLRPAQYRRS